jgi:hypothetical protein
LGRQHCDGHCRVLNTPAIVAITNRTDTSADLVVAQCESRGVDLFRFNSEEYPVRVGLHVEPSDPSTATLVTDAGDVRIGGAGIWIWRPQWPTLDPHVTDEWDAEFAKQEAVAALGGLLRLLSDRCVSPPDSMQAARWKLPQVAVAKAVGMLVPMTIATSDPSRAKAFAKSGPTVAKAVAESRVSLGDEERAGYVNPFSEPTDWASVRVTPMVLQRQVEKRADLRITVVGRRLFPVRITTPVGSPVDFRILDADSCAYEAFEVEPRLEAACLAFLDHFGLLFGAFDFAEDTEGRPWFLECNPAGQWGWLEEHANLPITSALIALLLSKQ